MEKKPHLSKKAAVQALLKNDAPRPEFGNLSAISVIKALDHRFFDANFCREFVLGAIHKNVAACPHCKMDLSTENIERFWKGRQFSCLHCKKKSHATTLTPLSGTTLSFQHLVCMAILFVIGFTDSQVAGAIGIAHHTVKKWRGLLGQG